MKAKDKINELKRIVKTLQNAKPSVATQFILADLRAKKKKYNIKN